MASSSKKRSSNQEVLQGAQDPEGLNDQEVSRPENSGSSEKASDTERKIKHRIACAESRKRIKTKKDKIETDRNEYKEENIRLRARIEMMKELAPNMLAEQREDNRHRREVVEKETDSLNKLSVLLAKPKLFGTTLGKDSTSASIEVIPVDETFQSLLASLGTIRLAYSRLEDRYAISEALYAQEKSALVESHAQEVATIKMEHQQELEVARAREQDLRAQLESLNYLNFDPDHDWPNEN